MLSYVELDARASRLAWDLKKTGITKGARAGIYTERAAEMVVALLGIMETEAVSVPLETRQPVARLTRILEDANLSLLITERRLDTTTPLFFPDAPEESSGAAPPAEDTGDNAACLWYRSGSGGRLAGVKISHFTLSNSNSRSPLSLTSSDRVAQPLNVARDASFFGLVNAIAAGACVIDTAAAAELPPRKFASFLNASEATVWLASAADLQRIGGEFPGELKKLRLILSDDPICSLRELRGTLNADLLNRVCGVYGHAETGGLNIHSLDEDEKLDQLELTGRADREVLIGGERIHLAEIESALRRHPAIRSAQVALTNSDQLELVAVLTPHAGQLPEPREVREFLQEQLPASMIPRIVVDPQTGTEEELIKIWQQVLKKEQVGVSDNFFDLGGQSMALVQVGALIKQRLGQKVSLPVLLTCSTIHSLASHLDQERAAHG